MRFFDARSTKKLVYIGAEETFFSVGRPKIDVIK